MYITFELLEKEFSIDLEVGLLPDCRYELEVEGGVRVEHDLRGETVRSDEDEEDEKKHEHVAHL